MQKRITHFQKRPQGTLKVVPKQINQLALTTSQSKMSKNFIVSDLIKRGQGRLINYEENQANVISERNRK